MEQLKQKMMELWKDEEGATMVEYGLMVALIAVVVMLAVGPLGTVISEKFTEVEEAVAAAGTAG
jgi:pilus assembly protein Flp/PilA